MTFLATRECACAENIALGQKRPPLCVHGNRYLTEAQRNPKPRKPLKPGQGFAASPEQRKKVRGLPCVVCGRVQRIEIGDRVDPAHVYPRRLASCECAEGVVPMCRACHRRYDDPDQHLDLLPYLLNRGHRAELVHAVVAHDAPIREVLEVVTGVKWAPVEEVTA